MRARWLANIVLSALAIGACAHEDRRSAHEPQAPPEPRSAATSAQSQYLIADPSSARGVAVALPLGSPGVFGLVVDRRRVLVGRGEPRVSIDATTEPIVGASKIPVRFGGGFLFWTANTLYRADAFDSVLAPLARVPEAIESISFAPKAVLVHTRDGARWGIGLPSGERAAIGPLGVTDVQALDDGRAVAWTDQGAVFTSTDHGAHWVDVTVQLKSAPAKVALVAGDLWVFEASAGASRVEVDGRLSWFDTAPSESSPELRPKDPRWRGGDAPLRAVLRAGAAIDDSTALVIDSGDLVRVDVRTGAVLSTVPGRLPPDASCEAVPVSGDVLFACTSRNAASGSAFVVGHTLASDTPVVEQTFTGGGHFYAGDDGGLAYAGSCQGTSPGSADDGHVCVRMPGGVWEERDLSGLALDGGASDIHVARWVPRVDGHVVAILVGTHAGVYDPVATRLTPLDEEAQEIVARGAASYPAFPGKPGRGGRYKRILSPSDVVDASWSFASGDSLRGWQRHGESIELSPDGKLTRSPYSLDVAHAGSMGLGLSKDGRLYQSSDHGASWIEVAAPPSGAEAIDLVSCTSAGCDLGAFYRVGWSARPPVPEPERSRAPAAPAIRRVRGLELACRAQGGVVSKVLARTNDSPDDLGLGVNRLPVASDRNEWSYVRNTVPRGIVSPIHALDGSDADNVTSLRALFSGFGTASDGDVITVAGPNKNAMSLRRGFSYVAPFDPVGRVVRTGLAMSDVVAAGRRAGMTAEEILAVDFTETGSVVPLTSVDPTAPSEVAIDNAEHGLIAIVRGERVRVAVRPSSTNASVVSGVVLGGAADESAFLELDSSGVGRVFKIGPAGVTDLFDVNPAANETYYPANPEALAVGSKGELVVLRMPSGSEPASALDPAYVLAPGTAPTALAPWSELKLADDPACKAEPGGYRAVLQLVGPWVRVTTPELRVEEAAMIARVRWTAKRVCLEGFEAKLPNANVRVPSGGSTGEPISIATWLVAKGSMFARVGVSEGVEWRQALECSVGSTGP
ncbi:MAG TPA: hypothetical protein VM925_05830 [Labilithrix sp.]|nr:hypothetical protein [Labilithrix sp.]